MSGVSRKVMEAPKAKGPGPRRPKAEQAGADRALEAGPEGKRPASATGI